MEQGMVDLINSVGFPIAVCIAFAYYINKRDTQKIESEKEMRTLTLESEKEMRMQTIEERKKLIETIESNRKVNEELLKTNSELSATNRKLVEDFGNRMNNIENTLLEINQKI